ncbi:hypothetical protein [Pontibacter anaerobius]|uniref:Lipoprotein n=1 Tax=Pontibacter anaerobius TaxID=2993940 RepID=A0ABT3RC70_9BACT|nr:hypothetical protein [Pontibacter anaerobius]MCX2739478.1 hypothetical protein [Pontibacter anaerobius]
MRLFQSLPQLIVLLFSLSCCRTKENGEISGTAKDTIESDNKITCIDSISILHPKTNELSTGRMELFLSSADTNLNRTLESKLIDELTFKEGGLSKRKEKIPGLIIMVRKIRENHYKLLYFTNHFIGYPIDTVEEKGEDFMETAQIIIKDKQGRQWNIKTCLQVQ